VARPLEERDKQMGRIGRTGKARSEAEEGRGGRERYLERERERICSRTELDNHTQAMAISAFQGSEEMCVKLIVSG